MAKFGKILILGARGYSFSDETTRVFSVGWDELQKIKNLRDYDVLILDLFTGPPVVEWQRIYDLLDEEVMVNILRDGEILIIGDPRFNVETSVESGGRIRRPFLEWTATRFQWHNERGDTVEVTNEHRLRNYQPYLDHLHRWDYALDGIQLVREQLFIEDLNSFMAAGGRVRLEKTRLAWNRYGKDLAFRLNLILEAPDSRGFSEWEPVRELGHITFLPQTDLSEQESLLLLLRNLYGVESGATEPEWLLPYVAPGQQAVDQQIEHLTKQLEETSAQLSDAQLARAETRECLRLLYERGKPLEDAVRDILQVLGAEVEIPKEEGKEDGWISVVAGGKALEGVLEIKGTNSDQFDISGFRQLLEWHHRGIELRHKKYKPIFIGNSAADRPVDKRPVAFSDTWQKSAELASVVAVKTEDLYYAYELKLVGKLDVTKFWDNMFATDGVLERAKVPLLPEKSTTCTSNLEP
jgi:hypothetical protein